VTWSDERDPFASSWRDLDVIKFSDMRAQLDGRPLIKGYLYREQTSLIIGDPGSGKTFLALDRDLHIAAGLDWFGRKVSQGPVVYLATEAGRSIQNRVVAWRQEHGFENTSIPFAAITSPVDLCHATEDDIKKLIVSIAQIGFGLSLSLLEIDTVSRAMAGGNENSPDDMGAFIRSLDHLREKLRCHVSAVHHFGKDHDRGARGHNSLFCAIDTETRVEDKTATVTKQRDGPCEGQFPFKLRPITLGLDEDGDPVTSCIVEQITKDGGTPAPPPTKIKLNPRLQIALDTLKRALRAHGTPAGQHFPFAVGSIIVRTIFWQVMYAKATQYSEGASEDSVARDFRRKREALLSMKIIGADGELVWLTDKIRTS
jgi:hypothetical protein